MNQDQKVAHAANARETNTVGDDRYLVEMTERLKKLRDLMGETETRKSGPKRWMKRASFGSEF